MNIESKYKIFEILDYVFHSCCPMNKEEFIRSYFINNYKKIDVNVLNGDHLSPLLYYMEYYINNHGIDKIGVAASIISILLNIGADINAVNPDGHTLLDMIKQLKKEDKEKFYIIDKLKLALNLNKKED